MVWLVHPTLSTWRFRIWMNSTPWNTCFTSNSKTGSLVKIDSKALQRRFWMPSTKRQIGWGHERTHSSRCISKAACFECYRKTKRCLMKLLMFIHMKRPAKEDSRVCWISNSRQLNKVKRRKQYPLPIIMDILHKHFRYKFFTKLDISMQCYTFELDNKKSTLPYHHHTIW